LDCPFVSAHSQLLSYLVRGTLIYGFNFLKDWLAFVSAGEHWPAAVGHSIKYARDRSAFFGSLAGFIEPFGIVFRLFVKAFFEVYLSRNFFVN
jgi:hypothetical protein